MTSKVKRRWVAGIAWFVVALIICACCWFRAEERENEKASQTWAELRRVRSRMLLPDLVETYQSTEPCHILDGPALLSGISVMDRTDAWGNPIRLISPPADPWELVSDGPDGEPRTSDDISYPFDDRDIISLLKMYGICLCYDDNESGSDSRRLNSKHLQETGQLDAWGRPIGVRNDGQHYILFSLGEDGLLGTDDDLEMLLIIEDR